MVLISIDFKSEALKRNTSTNVQINVQINTELTDREQLVFNLIKDKYWNIQRGDYSSYREIRENCSKDNFFAYQQKCCKERRFK